MRKVLIFAVVMMIGLSSCNVDPMPKETVQSEQETKYLHPIRIGGRWHYFYY